MKDLRKFNSRSTLSNDFSVEFSAIFQNIGFGISFL